MVGTIRHDSEECARCASDAIFSLIVVEPRDQRVLLTASTMLALVRGMAGWLPAHRAANLNPVDLLRAE